MVSQAIETALPFSNDLYAKKQMKMLDDINAGDLAGLRFDEIRALHPKEITTCSRNKLLNRWPRIGGEGYVDVINRLRPVILELERVTSHLLLTTHRSIMKVLLAYFLGLQHDGLVELDVKQDSVFCLEPVCIATTSMFKIRDTDQKQAAYGVSVRKYCYNPESHTFDRVH